MGVSEPPNPLEIFYRVEGFGGLQRHKCRSTNQVYSLDGTHDAIIVRPKSQAVYSTETNLVSKLEPVAGGGCVKIQLSPPEN